MTIQRDTDGDGNPDVSDSDNDNDGDTDEAGNDAETDSNDEPGIPSEDGGDADTEDTEAPFITPIPDVSAVENEPIEEIVVETDEPSTVIVNGLPDGVIYDPDTGVISGTPVVEDWAEAETERAYTVTVTAEDEAGNTGSIEFNLNLERDVNGLSSQVGSDQSDDGNDGNESETATLPQTGEKENSLFTIAGLALTALGGVLLAWTKKGKEWVQQFK